MVRRRSQRILELNFYVISTGKVLRRRYGSSALLLTNLKKAKAKPQVILGKPHLIQFINFTAPLQQFYWCATAAECKKHTILDD